MNILIVGNGGREHALGWKLSRSKKITRLFFAPGNGGTSELGVNLATDPHRKHDLYKEIVKNRIDFVVVAQDEYLAAGLVDFLQKRKVATFGPTKAAAKLEWSKGFAKRFMLQEGIPTAGFKTFSSFAPALRYLKGRRFPQVIKADGLIYGKGVVIAKTLPQAANLLKDIFLSNKFGKAGATVVVEEFLEGKEISVHAFCDGKKAVLFPASQDHKRAFDNERGPNTGGMGSIVPVPWVTAAQMEEINKKIVLPVMRAMRKRGTPFQGILYPGIMLTSGGPKVIEFNARFGDPEAQSYMHLLQSDLLDILLACARGQITRARIVWHRGYEACVVVASGGYPGPYKTGYKITGISKKMPGLVIFHAGTTKRGRDTVTRGGRVLGVSALGRTLSEAVKKAYTGVRGIRFKNMHYRKDIGKKSLGH